MTSRPRQAVAHLPARPVLDLRWAALAAAALAGLYGASNVAVAGAPPAAVSGR